MNKAEAFALAAHRDQLYGTDPYERHLRDVVRVLAESGFENEMWSSAGWLHDVVEDTDVTVIEVAQRFGIAVAHLVHAVTDGEGATRAERKQAVWEKIALFPAAAIVKTADRIANVEAGGKLEMYRAEQRAFELFVLPYVPGDMSRRLILGLQ